MASSSGGRFDDRTVRSGDANDDATRIVTGGGRPGSPDDDATRILTEGQGGGDRSGTLIGQASDFRGSAGYAGHDHGTVPLDGSTQYLPPQPEQGDLAGRPFDPVVGWLTVREGPGRGNVRNVYYDVNSLGRGDNQRISLDFGDPRISREAHAYIVYDKKQRKFFVRDNAKPNPVYLNGDMVMVPTELKDRDQITIGDTTLMFIALCNADFDWYADDAKTKA